MSNSLAFSIPDVSAIYKSAWQSLGSGWAKYSPFRNKSGQSGCNRVGLTSIFILKKINKCPIFRENESNESRK